MVQPELDLEVREDPAHWINFDLSGAGAVVLGFAVVLYGWSVENNSTTTEAAFDIYDGTDTSGKPVFPVRLSGNETSREWFDRGVAMLNGVYVNVTAQEVHGALFYCRHRG